MGDSSGSMDAEMLADGVSPSPSPAPATVESRRFLWELSRNSMDINRDFYHRLDVEQLEREKQHQRALALAALEHERVRNEALQAAEIRFFQEERDRVERERAHQQALDRLRAQAAVEDHTRSLEEERERQEHAQKLKQIEEERARVEEQRRRLEQEAKQHAEDARRHAEQASAAAAVEAAKIKSQPTPVPEKTSQIEASEQENNSSTPSFAPNIAHQSAQSQQDIEKVHLEYLQIHQNLKSLRRDIALIKKSFGSDMGDFRRLIQQTVGQYTIGPNSRQSNLALNQKLRQVFNNALQRHPSPTIDVRRYIRPPYPANLSEADFQAPILWTYLVHILAKKSVTYFTDGCNTQTELAEPVGVMLANLFSKPPVTWKDMFMFDMIIAKYHVCCPILFGITGNDKTEAGKIRLGWRTRPSDNGKGKHFIPEREHHDRMTGLGAGFTAISLRDFSKSKGPSPFPHANFWRAMAYIINTPGDQATSTHFVVLKAILSHCLPRFVHFYGQAAVAALDKGVNQFPKEAHLAPGDATATAVTTLNETFQKDYHLILG